MENPEGDVETEQQEARQPPEVELTDEEVADLVGRIAEGEAFREVLEVDEETIRAIELQAHSLLSNARYDEAETLAKGLVALDPERSYPIRLLGELYFVQAVGPKWEREDGGQVVPVGLFEQARDAFECVRDMEGADTFTSYRLGEIELRLGNAERAGELLGRALAEDEDSSAEFRERAESLRELALADGAAES